MYPSYGFTNPAHYPPTQEKLGKRQMVLFHFLLGTLVGTQWRSLISKYLICCCHISTALITLQTMGTVINGDIISAEDSFVAIGVGA